VKMHILINFARVPTILQTAINACTTDFVSSSSGPRPLFMPVIELFVRYDPSEKFSVGMDKTPKFLVGWVRSLRNWAEVVEIENP